jgi:hypothetical protein
MIKKHRTPSWIWFTLYVALAALAPTAVRAEEFLLFLPRMQQSAYTITCDEVTEIPDAECEALARLFWSTGGPSWHNTQGWLSDSHPCAWHGVDCEDSHVTSLHLNVNNLRGVLPTCQQSTERIDPWPLESSWAAKIPGPIKQQLERNHSTRIWRLRRLATAKPGQQSTERHNSGGTGKRPHRRRDKPLQQPAARRDPIDTREPDCNLVPRSVRESTRWAAPRVARPTLPTEPIVFARESPLPLCAARAGLVCQFDPVLQPGPRRNLWIIHASITERNTSLQATNEYADLPRGSP